MAGAAAKADCRARRIGPLERRPHTDLIAILPMVGTGEVIEIDETIFGRASTHPKGGNHAATARGPNMMIAAPMRQITAPMISHVSGADFSITQPQTKAAAI